MSLHDLGAQHPNDPSQTREWADRERAASETFDLSNRRFLIALVLVVIALAVFALLLFNL